MNVNATLTVKGEVPFPCLVPDAMVCGLVDSVSAPAVQLAFGFPPPPGVALLQVTLMALNGTNGQLAKEAAAAFTVKVQLLAGPPLMLHEIVPEVFPVTGVVSGSGELNVIVEGAAVTIPVMANANFLSMILGNAMAPTGRFEVQSAALQTVETIKHPHIASRSAIGAIAIRLPRS